MEVNNRSAVVIKPNRQIVCIGLKENEQNFSLEFLQDVLEESHVQELLLPSNLSMIVDEDGVFKDLPFNEWASTIVGKSIYGIAFLCNKDLLPVVSE